MSARSRSGRSTGGSRLRRTTGTRIPRKTFRVYVEGTRTEPEYIDALKRLPEISANSNVGIEIIHKAPSPLTLVTKAGEDRLRDDLDIDEYWCVFDVESPQPHPRLHEARRRAEENGIHLAVSNPSFELWLILHRSEQGRYLTTADAERTRRALDGSRDKGLNGATYMLHRADAVRRAQLLEVRHRKDGTEFPDDNPSSSFYAFVMALDAAAKNHGP